jgi:glutathione S-transferase
MKLLYSPTSPYSAKARMAAKFLGLDVESVTTSTEEAPDMLTGNNPLGKIPVLIREGAPSVYDSRAIMQYFNRMTKNGLYPRNPEKRTEAEVFEALCDGITDCLLAIVYERRMRPAELVHQPWIDRQWTKVTRGLDHIEANLPKTNKNLHGGHFALAALIGYLTLRFPGQWEKGRPKLKNWTKKFEKFFPAHADMVPQAPK